MKFIIDDKVKFKHCDTAGIVFYPRYFEMLNDTIEDWFEVLGLPFCELHSSNTGVPMVNIECNFKKPSYLGDVLKKELSIIKLGKSSCTLKIEFIGKKDESLRVEFFCTIVNIDLAKKTSNFWSDEIKNKMNKYLQNKEEK